MKSVITCVSYEDYMEQFDRKTATAKVGGKKLKVKFNVLTDDYNIADAVKLSRVDENILALDYRGGMETLENTDLSGAYVYVEKSFSNNFDEDDVRVFEESLPIGVTPIIKLYDEYKNIRFLYQLCNKFKRVRFTGGVLMNFGNTRFGWYPKERLEKCNADYDKDEIRNVNYAQYLSFEELELTVAERSAGRKRSEGHSSSPKTKRVDLFKNLLYGSETFDL